MLTFYWHEEVLEKGSEGIGDPSKSNSARYDGNAIKYLCERRERDNSFLSRRMSFGSSIVLETVELDTAKQVFAVKNVRQNPVLMSLGQKHS